MIRTLSLANFKCFESVTLRFGPLSLLAGLNGTGKSSILQAMLLLRQSHNQNLLETAGLALNGSLVRLGTAKDALYEGASRDEIRFVLTTDVNLVAEWCFPYDKEADVLSLGSESPDPQVFEENLFGDDFHYLQAERIGPRSSFEMSDFEVRRGRQIGPRGEFAAHFLAVHGRGVEVVETLRHPNAVSASLIDQVEAWLGEITPGVRLHLLAYTSMDLVSLEYSYAVGELTGRYRSTNIGFGVTYALPLLVALLSLQPGGLLILENPEAHLHPHGQVKMGRLAALAAAAGVQVIVETHSDHVLNGIRVAARESQIDPSMVQLLFFQGAVREGRMMNEVVSPNLDRDGRIDIWPEGFFDQWEISLEQLLLPRSS